MEQLNNGNTALLFSRKERFFHDRMDWVGLKAYFIGNSCSTLAPQALTRIVNNNNLITSRISNFKVKTESFRFAPLRLISFGLCL